MALYNPLKERETFIFQHFYKQHTSLLHRPLQSNYSLSKKFLKAATSYDLYLAAFCFEAHTAFVNTAQFYLQPTDLPNRQQKSQFFAAKNL